MASSKLDSKIPGGPIETMWEDYKFKVKLVNPANKKKHSAFTNHPAEPIR